MTATKPARLTGTLLTREGLVAASVAHVPSERRPAGRRIRLSLWPHKERQPRPKLVATHANCTLHSLFTHAIDEYLERYTPEMLEAAALLRTGEYGAPNANASGSGSNCDRGRENANGRL